jgi:hypothetical protein
MEYNFPLLSWRWALHGDCLADSVVEGESSPIVEKLDKHHLSQMVTVSISRERPY